MKFLTPEEAEEAAKNVSLPQPIQSISTTSRPQTTIPTPGRLNPKPKEPEPTPTPPPSPPPPPTQGENLNPELVQNRTENRAKSLCKEEPYNPYRHVIEPGDEDSRDVLRQRDKDDYEFALEHYIYRPETGALYSKISRRLLTAKTGDGKRLVLNFRGKRIYQHSLAYLFMIGHWPEEPLIQVGDTLDNRWDNLRLRSTWTPEMKPGVHTQLTNEEIEAKAAAIPKHVMEGRKYPVTVDDIVETFEFRAEGDEGVLFSKRTKKEVGKPKTNSKGRHRVVFVTGTTQMMAHIISYILHYREFPKGNLGARDGNRCNIHPANLKPLWAERKQDV